MSRLALLMAGMVLVGALVGGVLGILWATNKRLYYATRIINVLNDQIETNRFMIEELKADRKLQDERYNAVMGALELERRRREKR